MMEEMQQLTLIPDGTPEQAQAMSLHCEIMATAQAAADSLLALGRKLKQMRDTGGYRHLGFASFGEYTEQAVGIRQRQAYNYITVVEKVPARLVEENAAAGVTKLALLGKLGPADQREVAGELANITVEELKQIIDERNGMAEQLSLLQAEPAAEAESREVDMDALRSEMLEQARAEVKEQHAQAMRKALQEQGEKLAADRKAAEAHAAEQAKKEAERKAREQVAQAKAEAAQAAEKKLAEEREAARRDQEEKDKADLEAARQEAAEARAAAEETAKRLQLNASEESIRFALLFEQLQGAAGAMMDLVDALTAAGRAEEAAKLRTALSGALQALAEQVAV